MKTPELTPEEKVRELRSWKEIASYLGRDVRTVIRWGKEKGLPVRRQPGPGGRVTILADANEVDQWLVGHSEEAQSPVPQPGRRWNPVNALTVGVCLIILIVGSVSFYWRRSKSSGLRRPLQFATTIHEALAPTGIVAADLNGDGNLDIVIAESANDSILILFGDSNGSFSKSIRIPEGRLPERLATGDFNADGAVDLVVTNRGSGDVAVLLGNGHGGFHESFRWNSSGRSRWVTVADLNQDGKADLAVACSAAQKVGVLMGNGDGSFGHIETYDTDGEPSGVVVADFNLDGVNELAVSDYQIGGGQTISLYQGNGDGSFRARFPARTGFGPLGLAVADLNRDGRPDVVTADFQDSVSVLLGKPGGFEEFRKLQAGKGNGFVATGDFDGDGSVDLVVTGEHSDSAHILFGDGMGGFDSPEFLATGKYPDAIVVGDFNRDGKLDFAVANTHGDSVSVFINQSSH